MGNWCFGMTRSAGGFGSNDGMDAWKRHANDVARCLAQRMIIQSSYLEPSVCFVQVMLAETGVV